MSQPQIKSREFVTKEIFIALTPLLAASMWTIFFEAGFSHYYGIPKDLISLNLTDVFLTNRLSLLAAVVGFLWIGLYYNLMPSFSSLAFKAIVTFFLVLSIAFGLIFGFYSGQVKENYYILSTLPEQVVIKIYDSHLITAKLNAQTHTFERIFYIHPLNQIQNTGLSLQKIGPLKPM